jgi:hypothetical protein
MTIVPARSLAALVPLAPLLACGTESDRLPSAVDGLRASATQKLQADDGALLVGNLTTPVLRTGNGILRYEASSGAFVDAFVPRAAVRSSPPS